MCGISGIIAFDNMQQGDDALLKDMRNAILHRGPDHQGLWNNSSVGFAHNRLSIIDLSDDANQPMLSPSGDIVICFNGEIYNHQEIRSELEGKQEFRTDHSDTEVIINAYKQWGINEALKRFRGMFAFALYDTQKEVVFLVRDRLGKKPLYFSKVGNRFYFSSEIKALLQTGVINPTVNDEAIYDYLSLLTVKAPATFFKNISKLEAGTYLEISKKDYRRVQYWDIANAINRENKSSYEEAVNGMRALLLTSMEYRNVSDVPISVALSGGVDSSLNLLFSSQKNKDINAINLDFETDHEFNESVNAQKFSKEIGVRYTQLKINTEQFEAELMKLCELQMDMPFGDPNSVLLYYISKEARRQGAKILLVGEGGDELGGYPVYKSMLKEYRMLSIMPGLMKPLLKYLPLKKRFDFFYKGQIVSRRQVHGFTEFEKKKFWKGKPYNTYKVLYELMNEIKGNSKDSFLRKVLNIEYKLRLPELILARVDYPTMAASVEARSPYMDYQLIEYCAGLSFEKKMKYGPKSIIKEIAKDSLPDYIVNGKKVGFGMLLHPFLTGSLPELFRKDILQNPDAPVRAYIEDDYLNKLWKSSGAPQEGYRLWIIYSLNKWLMHIR